MKVKVKFLTIKMKSAMEKHPCLICTAMGHPGQFYPETSYWYKEKIV